MKIMHIVGNRPQFIKLAVLYPELDVANVNEMIVHTGQHFDPNMSEIFFSELKIPQPHFDLGINQLSHNEMIGNMLIEIDRVISVEAPELVIVYGDTNTTLAGALAAKKRNVRLAHIEAGIRTGDEQMPEESNRYLVDRMSDLNFCCTYLGMKNLEIEGFSNGHIKSDFYLSGDLMLDAAKCFGSTANKKRGRDPRFQEMNSFILATIHREENTGDLQKLKNIIDALNALDKETRVVMPLHPRTKFMIEKHKLKLNFETCDAMGYFDMLYMIQQCRSVITDSGGLSREAFFYEKPALVIMRNPFWPEIFIHGNCLQADPRTDDIISKQDELLKGNKPFNLDIFGTGRAAKEISKVVLAEI